MAYSTESRRLAAQMHYQQRERIRQRGRVLFWFAVAAVGAWLVFGATGA